MQIVSVDVYHISEHQGASYLVSVVFAVHIQMLICITATKRRSDMVYCLVYEFSVLILNPSPRISKAVKDRSPSCVAVIKDRSV